MHDNIVKVSVFGSNFHEQKSLIRESNNFVTEYVFDYNLYTYSRNSTTKSLDLILDRIDIMFACTVIT